MEQNYLACDREQELLLPPSLRKRLPGASPHSGGRLPGMVSRIVGVESAASHRPAPLSSSESPSRCA